MVSTRQFDKLPCDSLQNDRLQPVGGRPSSSQIQGETRPIFENHFVSIQGSFATPRFCPRKEVVLQRIFETTSAGRRKPGIQVPEDVLRDMHSTFR